MPALNHASELLGPGDAVFVLDAPSAPAEPGACPDLFAAAGREPVNVLGITYKRSARDGLADWTRRAGDQVADATILSVEATTRSAAGSNAPEETASGGRGPEIRPVSPPDDLVNLGRAIVAELERFDDDPDRPVVACVHSLTALLQYVPREDAFKFLKVVLDRLASADAVAHCHADPLAHDEQTVRTFSPLFDAVCEFDGGEWTLYE